jgi:hypothetical protein
VWPETPPEKARIVEGEVTPPTGSKTQGFKALFYHRLLAADLNESQPGNELLVSPSRKTAAKITGWLNQ